MKRNLILLALAGIFSAGIFTACLKDECTTTKTYVRFDPVYKSPAEIRAETKAESPRPMRKPGKIYYYQNYLLINELYEGIHVFDNSNPENPSPVVFWNIPGNVDMAIKGGILYADQYTDLLTFDIGDFQSPQLICRTENVFQLYGYDPYKGHLVKYDPTTVTEEISCNDERFNQNWWLGGGGQIWLDDSFGGPVAVNENGGIKNLGAATGLSGSFSRLCFNGDYLYGIDNSTLYPFKIGAGGCPTKLEAVPMGWNMETIFPYKDRLFIGSQTGVFIFNATNPAKPVYESAFFHATGCDPVVADDDYAFVTVHGGTTCNGTSINQLDIIGITHLPTTALLKSYPMTKPLGLGLDGKYLYLCDDGLKIFDRSDVSQLVQLAHNQAIKAYDVIALGNGTLLIIGEDGFYQFDVSDPSNPKQISRLAVQE